MNVVRLLLQLLLISLELYSVNKVLSADCDSLVEDFYKGGALPIRAVLVFQNS